MRLLRKELLENELYQVLDEYGAPLSEDWKPPFPIAELKDMYFQMLFTREADMMAVSFQRQGRMYTYPPNLGQEAVSAAAGRVIREQDWLVPAFRELGAWLAKGVSMREIFLYFRGNEEASKFPGAPKMFPISVPIASQLPHAVGIAKGAALKGENSVVFTFVGDGGTSQGDFHEALNFAGVWKVPLVCIIQNNQFAISVSVKKQTASVNLAVKALSYGLPGIKVDGNDFFAMYDALVAASEHARSGDGPVVIEALTYRKGAHTTSDDPSRYRTKQEEEEWDKKDPLFRMREYLLERNGLQEEEEKQRVEQFRTEIARQFEEAENHPSYELDDVFAYMYEEMPDGLAQQKNRYEKYLSWKERQG